MNHGGSLGMAKKHVLKAKDSNADMAKLQTYVTEKLQHPLSPSYESCHNMELTFRQQEELFVFARENNVTLFSTPYDFQSVDFLEEMDVPAFKIASMDVNNIPFLEYIGSKGRPVMLSTGLSTLSEIGRAVRIIKKTNENLILLYCVSNYPAQAQDISLKAISQLQETFNCPVGLSDHSLGLELAIAAAAMGAVVIEKHFTVDKDLAKQFPDADHDISLDPHELASLAGAVSNVYEAIKGEPSFPGESEKEWRELMRRGIYASRNLEKGVTISSEDIKFLRPQEGTLGLEDLDWIMGKRLKEPVKENSSFKKGILE